METIGGAASAIVSSVTIILEHLVGLLKVTVNLCEVIAQQLAT